MSKLEELIKELCPKGVMYIPINKCVTNIRKIKWDGVNHMSYKYIDLTSVDRETHIIRETQSINKDNAPSRAQQIVCEGDILLGTTRPMLKRFCMVDNIYDGQICSTGFCVLRAKEDIVMNRWLYHQISSTDFFDHVERFQKGASYPAISDADVKAFEIPLPPIEVQREIVRILDTFTELTAELTARKKQYEYYRDTLLTPPNSITTVPLADIADIGTGSSNTNEGLDEGEYPFFVRSQEVRRKNEYEFDETAIITAGDGVGVGKVFHYVEGKYALHQRAYRIHINSEEVLPKYFFYYMKSSFLPYIEKTMFQGSVSSIRRPMLNAFPVPVPAMDAQKRIVEFLENFESICSDLNIGLPAEIEARKKQYEFYRDALLTFAETGNIISQTEQNLIKLIQYVFVFVSAELNDVANTFRGEYITKKNTKEGSIPVILGGQEPAYYIDTSNHDGEIVVVARSGASAGFVSYWNEPIFVTDGFGFEAKPEMITPRYLYYSLKNVETDLNAMKRGAGVPHISGELLGKWVLPVPSIKEQERIVKILDRFDTLCNDLSHGLPAEIAARQKQYKYYRDRLLSFTRLPDRQAEQKQ